MTTTAPANRTLNVIRMQLLNKQTFVWLPLLILASSFAISMMIYGIIVFSVDDMDEPIYGGGSQAPLWYFLVVGVQALSFTFPFSQAMSITRREYFLGTYATAMLSSAAVAVTFLVGGLIERATDGWGIDGYFFYLPWIWDQGPFVALLMYFTIAMFAFAVGFWGTTLYKRFGTLWLVVTGMAIVVAIVLACLVVSLAGGWPAIGRWIVDLRPIALVGIVFALDLLFAGTSYLTLRRATP
ncbi:hypothetical protein L5G28_18935 [Gordonia sp. HY285]|uniref:hypothetical protein n=1 Tax=Gordonia liuliyuniae TaxID=2911517 RepID=UPI001F31FDBD|nr:hypothetical protein [Gordonia liuliyuniae]MCF8612222.1 hypothetical protein [Gordonia liuliyuniae]